MTTRPDTSSASVEGGNSQLRCMPPVRLLGIPPKAFGHWPEGQVEKRHKTKPQARCSAAPGPGEDYQRTLQYICWIGFTFAAFMAAVMLR